MKRKVNTSTSGMTAKQLEAIIKKHTSQVGQSIMFDISKAAVEISKSIERDTNKAIKERTEALEFKLTCIKQMLEDIELKGVKALKRIYALKGRKRNNKKKVA